MSRTGAAIRITLKTAARVREGALPLTPTTELRHATDDLIASGEATIGDVYESFGRPGIGRLARNCRQRCAAVPGFNPPHNQAVSDGPERALQIDELLNLPRQTKIRFIKPMKHCAT
jgi:hypothetical protein